MAVFFRVPTKTFGAILFSNPQASRPDNLIFIYLVSLIIFGGGPG